jgi:hypothetical protein
MATNRARYKCINVDHETYRAIRGLARAHRRSLLEQARVMAGAERDLEGLPTMSRHPGKESEIMKDTLLLILFGFLLGWMLLLDGKRNESDGYGYGDI